MLEDNLTELDMAAKSLVAQYPVLESEGVVDETEESSAGSTLAPALADPPKAACVLSAILEVVLARIDEARRGAPDVARADWIAEVIASSLASWRQQFGRLPRRHTPLPKPRVR